MKKMYQGILGIIIGSAFVMSLWVLSNYFLVGGKRDENIMIPTPISIPIPIVYFLFFGGIGLILFGVLRLVQIIAVKEKKEV